MHASALNTSSHHSRSAAILVAALGAVAATVWLTRSGAGWAAMWTIAATEFALLKIATVDRLWARVSGARIAGYLLLWPGMNAREFLCSRPTAAPSSPQRRELAFALLKLGVGFALIGWAVVHVHDPRVMLVAWIGMLGLVFTLHFGLMHALSWLWRRAGVDAPPLMRTPIAATSLTELWADRWNTAFADAARRFVLRPLARRAGARVAAVMVFLVSGLLHETVISWPARGGWGGPTAYFLLQACGVAIEKSPLGAQLRLGGGVPGWLWTFFVAVAPLPLLCHGPFARNVIVPFFHAIANMLLS